MFLTDAGAVWFRPMMLTAAAVIVGSSVILFDPIFQGLALSLMVGEGGLASLSREGRGGRFASLRCVTEKI